MSASPPYYLSPHAYAAEVGGHAVFLDLRRDKYTAIAPEDLNTLRAVLQGWSSAGTQISERCSTGTRKAAIPAEVGADDVIAELAKEGLITGDAARGKAATPASLEDAHETFLGARRPWPVLTRALVSQFIQAWLVTTLMLKTTPIRAVVERARRRKALHAHRAPPFDAGRAAQLSIAHAVLQPAFYSAHDACLRNSLTLIEFLARFEVYPQWVFGVRMNPFAAHSWVQQGPVLFNDHVEHVKTFTPILVI